MDASFAEAMRRGQELFVADGGLGTTLASYGDGVTVTGGMWSTGVLREHPALVRRAHREFFQAGADIATTATYQGAVPGLGKLGVGEEEALELLRSAMAAAQGAAADVGASSLGREAEAQPHGHAAKRRLIAGSCGPYGAMLGGGQEFRGEYRVAVEEIVDFHWARAKMLWEQGCDVLAFETLPQLAEVRAALVLLDRMRKEFEEKGGREDVVAWVSLQCRDAEHLASGESAREAFALAAAHPQVVAVGCNCVPVNLVAPLLRLARSVTDKPLVACANIGQVWDGQTCTWLGQPQPWEAETVAREWVGAGARIIGGCCGAGPEHIRQLAVAVEKLNKERR